MKSLLCASTAIVSLLMGAAVAEACDCLVYTNPTSAQRMAEVKGQLAFADMVFVGEVVSVDDDGSTLRVITQWKGRPSTLVRMRHVERLPDGSRVGNTCRLSFHDGRYLVFAKSVGQDVWEASMCSGTGAVADQQSVLAILPKLCPAPGGCSAQAPAGPNNRRANADIQSSSLTTGDPLCVRFQSAGRLMAGTPFRADLLHGLEFRLSSGWSISVGPKDEPDMDYLWVVSPPLQTAPHLTIGPAYGMTARDSLKIERPLRFVLTKPDHSAAVTAIALQSDETLRRLDQLGKGRLSLQITSHEIRDIVLPDGRRTDAFTWITFTGEACVSER